MAMLAAPRRKQKVINLRAKNSEWSNDSTKFGQRMLEKMGWSSGKGLGAKENGIVEHVVAKYKNDDKGLGYEDRNDQWTKHEDDFNSLLANLSSGDNNKDQLHSGVSLEVKSKKSKARVHYHKFTRGKDLTRYSEKDLANIFGKKSFKTEEKVEEVANDNASTTEQVFTDKGSMEDYFKSKLAALKSSNKISLNIIEKDDYEADYSFRGFSGATENSQSDTQDVAFQGFSFYNNNSDKNECTNVDENETKKSKKKKKGKAEEQNITCAVETVGNTNDENQENIVENVTNESEPVKKKKKKKKHDKDTTDEININEMINLGLGNDSLVENLANEPVQSKKSKKKKRAKDDVTDLEVKTEAQPSDGLARECIEDHVPKKKKKRKNKIDEL